MAHNLHLFRAGRGLQKTPFMLYYYCMAANAISQGGTIMKYVILTLLALTLAAPAPHAQTGFTTEDYGAFLRSTGDISSGDMLRTHAPEAT